jgi:CRP-like cAMP-binding protein
MTGQGVALFPDRDRAIEWCEDCVLEAAAPRPTEVAKVSLADNELCHGLTDADLDALHSVLKYGRAATGARIIAAGESGDSILFITAGDVSVRLDVDGYRDVRVATLSAGMAVGEMAALGESIRTAHVFADSEVEYFALSVTDLERLQDVMPSVRAVLIENIAHNLASRLQQTNAELQALSA